MKKIILSITAFLCIAVVQQTFAQVTLLSNNTNLSSGIVVNGRGLLLSDSDSLWTTDGTPAGTTLLTNSVSLADSGGIAFLGNRLLFTGMNAANGAELWACDATAAGTILIKDIVPGVASSYPANFFTYNNKVLFTVGDGTNGIELWMTDGTGTGTTMLKDINPGSGSSFSPSSDPMFYTSNGIAYFVADDGSHGTEVWRTDGTPAGTYMLADVTAGAGGSDITNFTSVGNTLLFGVTVGSGFSSSYQLYRSDGTSAGTSLVKDFGAYSGFFIPEFYSFNGKLYFNGTDFAGTGTELWVTDGTTAGTALLKDIYPGTGYTSSSSPVLFNAVTINNKFYFEANDGTNGSELWMSDGTAAGTQMLKNINPSGDANPLIYKNFDYSSYSGYTNTLYNGKVFFAADDGTHGNELWVTDGTSAGTTMVKDINAGTASGITGYGYIYSTSGLFFTADDGTTGNEPYLSNGTDAGTSKIADVNPGANGSDAQPLFFLNNQLIFNATNGDNANNTDLFKVSGPLVALPVNLLDFSAALQPSNAVQLNWTTSNETNTSLFTIERSIDGNKFTAVANINAAGNSITSVSYAYLDQQAATLNSPVIYYRLKQVDKDGTAAYSKALMVRLMGGVLQFSFTPNPVQQQLNVMVTPAGAKQLALRIVDMWGKQVYQQNVAAGQSAYQRNINVALLQKGVYYIQLIADGVTKTQKFVKQ